jgi:hypothetical protein
MVYDRDPDQDLSAHQVPTRRKWDVPTLIIGLIVILTGGYLIVTGPSSEPPVRFQKIEANTARR